uniref:NAD(P)(+)--arginine ADP-ribosyltransferase n=1 Tax=Monopterus albus TaxID=43700 RepID=A0A3Q3J596_MONAL
MDSNTLLIPLWFLLCWVLSIRSVMGHQSFPLHAADKAIPLTLVEDSVDDMYHGCTNKMTAKVRKTYFPKENKDTFKDVGNLAEKYANKKKRDIDDEGLTKDHMQAICVYTAPQFYAMFNDHVRNNRSIYGTDFKFHALHFWLTRAVQILNKERCYISYRRTNLEFTGGANVIMRFGSFASTSLNKTLVRFGNKTCFEIRTCSGGYLKHYPVLGYYEQEVLIPPYEKFNITEKVKGFYDCEVVYKLESAGILSNLNCKAV